MKVAELEGARLDYWVARALVHGTDWDKNEDWISGWLSRGSPSTEWKDGGPIIEQERISLRQQVKDYRATGLWEACTPSACDGGRWGYRSGATPLIAAMRAFVASRFGDEVPDQEEQR